MASVIDLLPQATGEEAVYLQTLFSTMDDDQARQFSMVYRERRKEPQMILLLALVGLFGFAGIHRFVLDSIGMGILYFFTAGLCFIGTIIDLVNYKKLANEYNQNQAYEVANMVTNVTLRR